MSLLRIAILPLVVLVLLSVGCSKKEEILVYHVSKGEPQGPQPLPAMGAGMVSSEPGGEITDKPPASWSKQPSSPLRRLSYLIHGASGTGADVSLVVLEGGAGGLLDNVNRWRTQIGLAALDQESLKKASSSAATSLGAVTVVDMTGRPEKGDPSNDGRIVGAILPLESRTLFFKLRGNPDLAGKSKKEFLDWVGTVRITP